jgi:hypothetical protein
VWHICWASGLLLRFSPLKQLRQTTVVHVCATNSDASHTQLMTPAKNNSATFARQPTPIAVTVGTYSKFRARPHKTNIPTNTDFEPALHFGSTNLQSTTVN